MILRNIIENCKISDSMENNILDAVDISGISYNSQQIKHDCLFVAIRGEKFDGHNFIQDAFLAYLLAINEKTYAVIMILNLMFLNYDIPVHFFNCCCISGVL